MNVHHPAWFKSKMRNAGTSFFWASFFLPFKLHKEVALLYRFFRLLDDCADEFPETGAILIPHVRAWLLGQRTDMPFEHSFWNDVKKIINSKNLPLEPFVLYCDAQLREVHKEWPKNLDEFFQYCYGVAGTVGEVMAYLLKFKNQDALSSARALGEAMQITNILRDMPADRRAHRFYIPPSLQNKEGYKFLIQNARKLYIMGKSGIRSLENGQLSVYIAAELYEAILDKVVTQMHVPEYPRVFTSRTEKSLIIAKTVGKHFRISI